MGKQKKMYLENIAEEGAHVQVCVTVGKTGHISPAQFNIHPKAENQAKGKKRGEMLTRFGDKQIRVKERVLNDAVCADCGMSNETHKMLYGARLNRHHDLYDESDPLKYTRLLCNACHARWHKNRR